MPSITTKIAMLGLLFISFVVSSTVAEVYEEDFNIHRYTVYKDAQVPWIEAFGTCQADNSQLLYIDTVAELQFIRTLLNNSGVPNLYEQQFWTSGSDIYDENHYVWMTNAKPILRALWAQNEPNNNGGVEHCADLRWKPWDTFYLNDEKCFVSRYCVCKSIIGEYSHIKQEKNLTKQIEAERQILKTESNYEEYYLKHLLATMIVIAIALVSIALVIVKAELDKIMKAREGKIFSAYDNMEVLNQQ